MQELAPTSPRVGLVLQYLRDRPTPSGRILNQQFISLFQLICYNCDYTVDFLATPVYEFHKLYVAQLPVYITK